MLHFHAEEIQNMLNWISETITLPAALACIGALISASGALWATHEQNKSQKLADTQTIEIKQLNTKILVLSEENKNLAKEGISSITGGDGFAYIDILKGLFPNALAPAVISESTYPQYDLSIRFYDEDKDHSIQIAQPLTLNIATLPPGQSILHRIPSFDLDNKIDYAKFNLFISARNGSFFEELHLRKVDGDWFSAFRVFRMTPSGEKMLLLERAMEKYPRASDNTIIW